MIYENKMAKMSSEWIRCPVCKNKTRLKMREDTELKNFPLFCPKCKQETLISVKQLKITIHKEPDAKPINRAISRDLLALYVWA